MLPKPVTPENPDGVYDFSFYVQVGKGKGGYTTLYAFHHLKGTITFGRHMLHYHSINIRGYKKRLVRVDNKTGDVRVILRSLS